MRVAFVTQGARVPASRFRVDQIVPALSAHVACTVLPASPSVYGDLVSGKLHGNWRTLAQPLSVVSRLRQLGAIERHDVAWLQRPMVQYGFTALERHVAARVPTVFDFDDAIFHNSWGLARFKVRRIIDAAHHVVVGNRYLADFVDAPGKTTIIPTVVDADRYAVRPDPGDGPFTIVWTGLSSNLKELAPYAAAFRRVLAETGGRLVIIADRLDAPFLDGMAVEFVTWSPEVEVSALAAGHVGVMPIADSKYNRGKCGFKLIQYMARAIPVVASPVGANRDIVRDGVDGFHAATVDAWADALLTLARDADLRRRMGASARQRVVDGYSVTAVVPQYLDVLARVTA
ncbi:MAG: glycosyltransferase family 4 protein [Deltaproteobacteria bacterium]|nr:glycosyltransferase family 4 protein [Deltaproteobacteria bacterium]